MEIRIKIKPSNKKAGLTNKYALTNELLERACDYVNRNADVSVKIIGR